MYQLLICIGLDKHGVPCFEQGPVGGGALNDSEEQEILYIFIYRVVIKDFVSSYKPNLNSRSTTS